MKNPMDAAEVPPHAWMPRADCDTDCVHLGNAAESRLRVLRRVLLALLLVPVVALALAPTPGQAQLQRFCCRALLRCFGVRITVTGSPIRNLRGVLVVSPHMSWLDVFAIGSVLPGWYVSRADLFTGGPVVETLRRVLKVIPIERTSLRQLPGVVATVADKLRTGQTVVVFPEGTTWCGRHREGHGEGAGRGAHRGSGDFYPAMFQAAIDAGRPVQPLRLTYHHVDGSVSTAPAFLGGDALVQAICRLLTVRRTLACVRVESLQLPGTDRRALARRCQSAAQVGRLRNAGIGSRHVEVPTPHAGSTASPKVTSGVAGPAVVGPA